MVEKRRRKRIPRQTKEAVAERDGHTCRYCGTNIGPFQIDHVYPDSKGGVTEINNLVLACEDCNRKKSNVIGMWPKPAGYFSAKKRKISPRAFAIIALLLGTLVVLSPMVALLYDLGGILFALMPLGMVLFVIALGVGIAPTKHNESGTAPAQSRHIRNRF